MLVGILSVVRSSDPVILFAPGVVFKGTVSRDGYFFECLNILISTFSKWADGFQGLSKAFHYPIQLLTF
jgi:hypothetical protein